MHALGLPFYYIYLPSIHRDAKKKELCSMLGFIWLHSLLDAISFHFPSLSLCGWGGMGGYLSLISGLVTKKALPCTCVVKNTWLHSCSLTPHAFHVTLYVVKSRFSVQARSSSGFVLAGRPASLPTSLIFFGQPKPFYGLFLQWHLHVQRNLQGCVPIAL